MKCILIGNIFLDTALTLNSKLVQIIFLCLAQHIQTHFPFSNYKCHTVHYSVLNSQFLAKVLYCSALNNNKYRIFFFFFFRLIHKWMHKCLYRPNISMKNFFFLDWPKTFLDISWFIHNELLLLFQLQMSHIPSLECAIF